MLIYPRQYFGEAVELPRPAWWQSHFFISPRQRRVVIQSFNLIDHILRYIPTNKLQQLNEASRFESELTSQIMASRDDFVWPKVSLQTFDGVCHLGKEVEASFNDHSSTENLNSFLLWPFTDIFLLYRKRSESSF